MKIKEIRAVAVDIPGNVKTEGRRDPWVKDAEVANPMSRYPKYKRYRPSWMPKKWGSVWVQVIAEDGTFGIQNLKPGVYDVTIGSMTSTVRIWPFQAAPAGSVQQVAYQAPGAAGLPIVGDLAPGIAGGAGTGAGGGILAGTSGLLVGGAIIGVTAGIVIAITAS